MCSASGIVSSSRVSVSCAFAIVRITGTNTHFVLVFVSRHILREPYTSPASVVWNNIFPMEAPAICSLDVREREEDSITVGHSVCPKTISPPHRRLVPLFVLRCESFTHFYSRSHLTVSHFSRLPQFQNGFVTANTCNLLQWFAFPIPFVIVSNIFSLERVRQSDQE